MTIRTRIPVWRNLSWAVTLSALLISACSGGPNAKKDAEESDAATARSLASSMREEALSHELTEEWLQNYFDVLMNDSDPTSEIRRSIEQVVAIYYRAEGQLRVFDHELERLAASPDHKLSSVAEMKSYPKMLAYWEISHRARQRLAFVYDKLLDIRMAEPKTSDRYKKAHAALSALAQFAQDAQGSDRLALQSLATELKSIYEAHAAQVKARRRGELKQDALDFVLIKTGAKLKEMYQDSSVRDQLETKIHALRPQDQVIENVVEELSPEIREQLKDIAQHGRVPQSDGPRFYPSTGPHGTLSGSEYPTGVWSLTYDDGPASKYAPRVLKNLKDHGMKVTLFELAQNVQAFPKDSLAYLDAGMEMANHSFTHPQLPKLSDAKLEHEIGNSTEVETKVWGEENRPKLFRCPYGAGVSVARVRQVIQKHGMIHVFWNVDSLDWQDKNPESVFARAKKQMLALHKGIILFHDIHPQSVEASRMLMDWMQEQGLKQKPVGEVIEELNHE